MSAPGLRPAPATGRNVLPLTAGLVALALLTRVWPFLAAGGLREGESDSALFALGVWRWSRLGPHATLLYDSHFSPGYYWFCGGLARLAHWPLAAITPALDLLSVAAALATAVCAFAVARRFVSLPAAFLSTVLFLLAPGVWMLGLEPHPQGLGIVLVLLAFYLCLRAGEAPARRWALELGWVAALAAALLVRNDAIFLYPAFLLCALAPASRPRFRAQRAVVIAAGLATAAALYFGLRSAMLAESLAASEATSWRRIIGFLGHLSPLRQLLPVVTGLGPLLWLFAAAGLVLLWRFASRARFGLAVLWILVWAAPGSLFWLLIRGNNARHMAIYSLPLLWFACEGWARLQPRRRAPSWLALAAVAALALDVLLVPASSDVTIYPSGNVPASYRDLARRENDMRALARALAAEARPGATVHYLGTATNPYLILYAREENPGASLFHAGVVTALSWPRGGRLVFVNVFSGADFVAAARGLEPVHSLEYDARGRHLWFLGQEWTWLPLHRRWYVARARPGV